LFTGRWFASRVDGVDGISWDFYYLYGPDAIWETVPAPLVGTGGDHLWGTLLFGKTGSLPIGEMSFPGRGGFQRVPQNRVEWAFGEGIRLAQT